MKIFKHNVVPSVMKYAFLLPFLLVLNGKVHAQKDYDVLTNNWIKYSDAPNALYHHFARQAGVLLDRRAASLKSIQSLQGWQQRQRYIQKTLQQLVGTFPVKTALNAHTTKTIRKKGYTIEHVVYESQPGFFVTSSLYIPAGQRQKKLPAIIYCSGHAQEGYRSSVYQHVILNLVKKGFIVFAFDPVGQGERLEYFDTLLGKSAIGGPVEEHSYPGAQAIITGRGQARYMIWDGIRAVDYLFTREEVDTQRIGITGRSGGGTQTAYIAAFDERIKAAAPECYITNFKRLFESIGPQDAEQNLGDAVLQGIDHADLLLVRAPKPALMITTTRDFFSIQGARETAREVSRMYKAYQKDDYFHMVEDDAAHASTVKNREAMYAFFQKYLDNPGDGTDEVTDSLPAVDLQVTSTGQIATAMKSETVFSLNGKYAEQLEQTLQRSRQSTIRYREQVIRAAIRLSGYQAPKQEFNPVFTGRLQKEGYRVEKYFVRGEGDYVIPYLLMKPVQPSGKFLLYLHPMGKAAASAEGGEMEWFVKNGFNVIAPDMVGIGEMGPGAFQGDSYIKGVSYNVWFASMLVGRSIVGLRSADVIRLAHLIQKEYNAKEIFALARKEMTPVLLHAAAFDSTLKHIALIEPVTSYRSIVMNRYYRPELIHGLVPGALMAYDLPDLAASLAPRRLWIMGSTDGAGKPSPDESEKDYSIVREVYEHRKAAAQLRIVPDFPGKNYNHYREWIRLQ